MEIHLEPLQASGGLPQQQHGFSGVATGPRHTGADQSGQFPRPGHPLALEQARFTFGGTQKRLRNRGAGGRGEGTAGAQMAHEDADLLYPE